jgi:hypothetical protein
MKKKSVYNFLFFLFVSLPVMGQEFFVPPLINLSSYAFENDRKNLPDMRIWGWAKDKIAYTIETESSFGNCIQFYVKDLVTDEFIFSYVTEQFKVDDYYSDSESLEDIKRITDGFNQFEIQHIDTRLLPFPIENNNSQYKCTIAVEYSVNKRLEKHFVKSYSITIEDPRGELIVKTYSDLNYYWVELCGYFINPIDNKIVVVTCEKRNEYNTYYRFIGIN